MQRGKNIMKVNKSAYFYLKIKNNSSLLILIAVILLVTAIIQAAVPMGHNVINNEKNSVFEKPWKCSLNDGAFREVTLPSGINASVGDRITLKNRLPEQMVKGATILLRTSQQDAVVYVDNVMIYSSYNMETNVPSPSSAYHFVRLPVDCAEQEITVVLTSPYENYAGLMNQFYIGSKASNVFFLFHENGVRCIIGFLLFSVGFLLMVMFSFAKGQENQASIIYLGAFFVCAGYWVIVESRMAQFIFPYPVALTNSSIFALTLLPVFLGLYYNKTHIRFLKRTGQYMIAIAAMLSFSIAIATWISPALPLHALPYYLVFMGLYVITLFASIIVESSQANRFFSTAVYGMIFFSVCCLLELFFYLSDMKEYNESNFLIFGLLLFCIAMLVDSVQNFARVYETSIKVNTLSILAYTDSLTGLKNRTAFFEKLSGMKVDTNMFVSLVMFDINDLKVVNDTLGHSVGDAMIRHAAQTMKNSLRQEDELYRIGGDEFVAIICHGQEFDLNCVENRIVTSLAKEAEKSLSYHLNIAYGYATFLKNTDKSLFETLVRADEKMYACKKIQKAAVCVKSDSDCMERL